MATRRAACPNEELLEVERTAIPGPGSCGGMYTANTHGLGHRGARVSRCRTAPRRKRSARRSATIADAPARRSSSW
ncbi:MAG: dihydroxy-acid dehydratase [Nocardioides sp.]